MHVLNIKENLAEVDSDRFERGKHDDAEKCEWGDARGLFCGPEIGRLYWMWFQIQREPWMRAARNIPRPDQRMNVVEFLISMAWSQ